MECPRCGESVVRYALADGDDEAVACERCGYAGVPADHRPEPAADESWAEALARFYGDDATDDDRIEVTLDGTTYRVAPDAYERYRDRTEKQQNVIGELLREPNPTDPERTLAEIGNAAGVSPSYASKVIETYGDIAVAIRDGEREADAAGSDDGSEAGR